MFVPWQSVCYVVASWSVFRQGRKKVTESVNELANIAMVFLLLGSDYLSDLMKHTPFLTWRQNPVTFCISWWDFVGWFSLFTFLPFQLERQFGFHHHQQQQQLWFMPRLGPKTQLSCCIFGRNRVTVSAPSDTRRHLHLAPGFQAGPLASSQASCWKSSHCHSTACHQVRRWLICPALDTCLFLISWYKNLFMDFLGHSFVK